jgi:hypothetical protein
LALSIWLIAGALAGSCEVRHVPDLSGTPGKYDVVVADILLGWGFVVFGLLAVGGFVWGSVKSQRSLEKMQQLSDDLKRAGDQPPGVDGTGGFL